MSMNIINISDEHLTQLSSLKAGTWVRYTGKLLTIRDASQAKLIDMQNKGTTLPLSFNDRIVMYAAPAMSKKIIIGPTTSTRMDDGLEFLLKAGVVATIGKGKRSKKACDLIRTYKAPYFVLMSGVSAYLSEHFKKGRIVALKELGPEAIYEFTTSELLLITAIDANGQSIFN